MNVNSEIALKLQKLNFNLGCDNVLYKYEEKLITHFLYDSSRYHGGDLTNEDIREGIENNYEDVNKFICVVPNIFQVEAWLLTEHKLEIDVLRTPDLVGTEMERWLYYSSVMHSDIKVSYQDIVEGDEMFDNKIDARNDGINNALDYLLNELPL